MKDFLGTMVALLLGVIGGVVGLVLIAMLVAVFWPVLMILAILVIGKWIT